MGVTNDAVNLILRGEPFRNLCHSFYDEFVEQNVKFRHKAGVKSLIIRRNLGGCCDWCQNLAGIYVYGEEPFDVYRRHDSCRCIVTSKFEGRGYENVWTKKEYESQRKARIARQKELDIEDNSSRIIIRRKIEDYVAGESAAKDRLRRLLTEGIGDEKKDELVRKILLGNIPLRQRRQKYLQHVKDTPQYKNAVRDRDGLQSILMVSEEEAQSIILQRVGTGKVVKKTAEQFYEYVDLNYYVGCYPNHDDVFVKTKRLQIMHSKEGIHIVPVKELDV